MLNLQPKYLYNIVTAINYKTRWMVETSTAYNFIHIKEVVAMQTCTGKLINVRTGDLISSCEHEYYLSNNDIRTALKDKTLIRSIDSCFRDRNMGLLLVEFMNGTKLIASDIQDLKRLINLPTK